MKKFTLLSLACITLMISGCSKDDAPTTNDDEAQTKDDTAINLQEETVLNANTVSNGIIIEGAEKIQGNPPTPNGAINFELDYDQQSAFLKNGFDITFTTTDNYAGAYIQLKSEDGTRASEYIDVPLFSQKSSKKELKIKPNSFAKKINQTNEGENEIDVDFGADIPPGKFCYIICIYDAEGNIALPQEVCVEVEAWGGNSDIVGTWKLQKEEDIKNGVSEFVLLGEYECSSGGFDCNNNNDFVEYDEISCSKYDSFTIDIKQDGTFSSDYTFTKKDIDRESSRSSVNCEAVIKAPVTETEYFAGKWAYNEDTKELVLVEFSYTENGEIKTDENGYVYSDSSVVSTNSIIFIYENSIFDGTQFIPTSYKEYFVR